MTTLIRLTEEEKSATLAHRKLAADLAAFALLADWEEALCDEAYRFPRVWTGNSPGASNPVGRNPLAHRAGGDL